MTRTFVCLLAAFAVMTAGVAVAQPGATEIRATGSGSVSLPPDIATINAGIDTNAASANDAVSQNNAIYNRVVASLTKLGVARDDVTLAYYNVSYNPRPSIVPSNGSEDRYGFTVSRSFSVKVREIGMAGRVSDACTSSGATAINGVSFGLSNPEAARAQATAKAVAEARSNATTLAQAAGLHIVSIKSIESGAGGPGPVPLMRAAAAVNPPTEFDQSNVNVTVSVSIVFLAEP